MQARCQRRDGAPPEQGKRASVGLLPHVAPTCERAHLPSSAAPCPGREKCRMVWALPIQGARRCTRASGVAKRGSQPPRALRVQAAGFRMRICALSCAALTAFLVCWLRVPVPPRLRRRSRPAPATSRPFPKATSTSCRPTAMRLPRACWQAWPKCSPATRRMQVSRKHRPLAGIARADFDDEMKAEEATRETSHIGVVMIGFWRPHPHPPVTRAIVSCWARGNGARNTGGASTASSRP